MSAAHLIVQLGDSAAAEVFSMSHLDWEQIIKRVYDPANNALRIRIMAIAASFGTRLDAGQVFKMVYNEGDNFLRVVEA